MDWKSKRIRTILEAALAEDKVANDVTTALTDSDGAEGLGHDCGEAGVRRLRTGLNSHLSRYLCQDVPRTGRPVRSGEPSGDLRRG